MPLWAKIEGKKDPFILKILILPWLKGKDFSIIRKGIMSYRSTGQMRPYTEYITSNIQT
jgi:hypothetical protein